MPSLRARAVAALLLSASVLATQVEPGSQRVEAAAQALLDRFHGVMPRSPLELRDAGKRAKLAPQVLPVLHELQQFFAAEPASSLAPRALEFTVFALVFDDKATTAAGQPGDTDKQLLRDGAAVITATDARQRARAIDAVANGLARRIDAGPAPTGQASAAVVHCVLIAGDLTAGEARQLADKAADKAIAARLAAAADAASKDVRRLLDKPFEVKGQQLSGEPFTSRSLRGKVVLVDFWATWCQPCVRALPGLVAAQQKYGADKLAVLGVSCDRTEEDLKVFLAAHPEVSWTQLFEPGQKGWHALATELGITAIPRLFLIDREGVLRSVDAGGDLEALLARMLGE